ncbi:MAG: helix-turn-helix transcriptional regulator [Verrucomicrobia bacterium]|nr:helix-turn-helix transcriptional regulator [Verrucomicrobiota bacterium]MBT7065694.1 helix-turn-helix transcriptional regulator [Verrucomicrobiota bacterium]MBT7699105.1 helix-turn-helix transcriptional regulator [Verrucomicrobiota bacterium]
MTQEDSTLLQGDSGMYDFAVVRELRKREGWTIGVLAERTGVSAAVISKLERNLSMAELPTLYKVARAFGVNAADLLSLAEFRSAHVKHEEQHISGGFTFRGISYANARCLYGEAKAGATISRPEIHQDDYEICWVLEGSIRFQLPNETHELSAGDCIQFDALLEHTFVATEDCRIILQQLKKDKRF